MKVKYAKQNICEEWRKSSFVTPNFDLSSSNLGLFFITLKTPPFHFDLITFWLFIVSPSATGFIFNVVVFAFSSLNGLVKTCVLSFDVFSSSWEPWADAFGCFKVYVELRVDSAKTFEQFIPPRVILQTLAYCVLKMHSVCLCTFMYSLWCWMTSIKVIIVVIKVTVMGLVGHL